MVGTQMGTTLFDQEVVLDNCLYACWDDESGFTYSPATVDAAFASVSRYFTENSLETSTLIPIPGLQFGVDTPLEIEEGIELDHFTDAEFEACANAGVLSPNFPGHWIIDRSVAVGCRVTLTLKIVRFGAGSDSGLKMPTPAKTRSFGHPSWLAIGDIADDIMACLRLSNSEPIYMSGALIQLKGIRGTSSQYTRAASSSSAT